MKEIYRVRINNDAFADSPRVAWDNVGTMFCTHRKYHLGDYEKFKTERGRDTWEIILDIMNEDGLVPNGFRDSLSDDDGDMLPDAPDTVRKLFNSRYVSLPLYLYDHGGITMSCGPFGDPWDSGMVGMIFVSYKKAKEELGLTGDVWTPEMQEKTVACLKSEVEVYDHFITGSVYAYEIQKLTYEFEQPDEEIDVSNDELPWEDEDSSCGFYGRDNGDSMLDNIGSSPERVEVMNQAVRDLNTWYLLPDIVKQASSVD